MSAFDSYAQHYDQDFTYSAIGKKQRDRVYYFLQPLLASPKKCLELNCGTGADALYLSSKNWEVTALDQSQKMIEMAKAKDISRKINFLCCPIQGMSEKLNGSSYNFALSNFGGLNCLDPQALKKCSSDLYQCLSPGSAVALVIMGRKCLWEKLYFLWKGDRPKAYRRSQTLGVPTNLYGEKFLTWYYSPEEIKKTFEPHFAAKKVRPIGFFIPPSYLNSFFQKHSWLLGLLNGMEKLFGNFSFLSNYADHYLIVLVRKQDA